MAVINLTEGYYLEKKASGCMLYQRYKGKTKDGQPKESKRRIGYYGDEDKAIESYIKLIQIKRIPDTLNSLPEYIGAVKTANKATVDEIRRLLDDRELHPQRLQEQGEP